MFIHRIKAEKMEDPVIIHKAATTLIALMKPREQIYFTAEGLEVLKNLRRRRLVWCHKTSKLPEQNIWWITVSGMHWLHKHGLLDDNHSD